jgi:hypothetical protein
MKGYDEETMEIFTDTYEFLRTNRDWIFGGIGVSLIGALFTLLNPFSKGKEASNTNTNTNTATINNNIVLGQGTQITKDNAQVCAHTIEQRKKLTKILFIDDDTSFKVVSILKKAGWTSTKIRKDVRGPDDKDVLEADICFVDVLGVAKALFEKDQGLGLVGAIKDRHPAKKVVVYSSQEEGEVFNELWDKADAKLRKNAEPYQFENLLENFSAQIYC